jgi:hypothetical protein
MIKEYAHLTHDVVWVDAVILLRGFTELSETVTFSDLEESGKRSTRTPDLGTYRARPHRCVRRIPTVLISCA